MRTDSLAVVLRTSLFGAALMAGAAGVPARVWAQAADADVARGGALHVAVPPAIEAPADVVPFFAAHAEGTQNYVCLPASAGVAWKFVAPQATLTRTGDREGARQAATHFLSPNPDETGTPRPTWQDSVASDRVWGRAAASSTDPGYVAPGAIPWLLVEVVGAESGSPSSMPAGASHARLTETRFIHRVHTAGGAAPSTGCRQASDVGALVLVPYAADYVFYALGRQR